ncbi:MAG TPA: glycosyltransferase family 9 protein [Chloroflexota bacterium]|nr:glycosyltransferase family 9 protein [Chloroflexota bacterium]
MSVTFDEATRQGVRRLAIVRALHLGDFLLAVPALRSIRAGFPNAEITYIGLPWAEPFVRRYHRYLDRFVEFPGYPGIDEVEYDPALTKEFLERQRAYGYDLAIQMHGSGTTSLALAFDLGARLTAGYYPVTEPAGLAAGARYPDEGPEVLRNLGLAWLLGCPATGAALEFPITGEDLRDARRLLHPLDAERRPWIGIHPGSRSPARRWPAESFAAVADEFARRYGAAIVITGSRDEAEVAHQVACRMDTRALVLAGETSIGGLAAVIGRLDLFVSNDTGPAHLAEAVDTPSITIFGPADPDRWAPLDTTRHAVVRRPVKCSPCGHWVCPIDHRCLRRLEPDLVLAAADDLLRAGVFVCST